MSPLAALSSWHGRAGGLFEHLGAESPWITKTFPDGRRDAPERNYDRSWSTGVGASPQHGNRPKHQSSCFPRGRTAHLRTAVAATVVTQETPRRLALSRRGGVLERLYPFGNLVSMNRPKRAAKPRVRPAKPHPLSRNVQPTPWRSISKDRRAGRACNPWEPPGTVRTARPARSD